MGITYNKETASKNRHVVTRGPRDRQMRESRVIDHHSSEESAAAGLRERIQYLEEELVSRSKEVMPIDQVNDHIAKHIEIETTALKNKHGKEVDSLNTTIVSLKLELSTLQIVVDTKNELITELKHIIDHNKLTSSLNEDVGKIDSYETNHDKKSIKRPEMTTIFIDPSEESSRYESHVQVAQEEKIVGSESMNSKVSKLKNILGGLPPRK